MLCLAKKRIENEGLVPRGPRPPSVYIIPIEEEEEDEELMDMHHIVNLPIETFPCTAE